MGLRAEWRMGGLGRLCAAIGALGAVAAALVGGSTLAAAPVAAQAVPPPAPVVPPPAPIDPSGRGDHGGWKGGSAVLSAVASAEAAAFGGAPHLLGRGADLLFLAPALINRADGMAAGLHRLDANRTLASVAGTGSVDLGDFAAGVQVLSEGGGRAEFAASLGHARELFGLFSAGAVVKYAELRSHWESERAVLADVGVARDFGPALVSVSARNLEADEWGKRGGGIQLPTQVALGASTESFEVGEFDLFLTAQVLRERGGDFIPAGGFELSYWPVQGYTFRLRAGLARRGAEDDGSPLSLGFAFTGDALTVEYAFQPEGRDGWGRGDGRGDHGARDGRGGRGDVHFFGLRFR